MSEDRDELERELRNALRASYTRAANNAPEVATVWGRARSQHRSVRRWVRPLAALTALTATAAVIVTALLVMRPPESSAELELAVRLARVDAPLDHLLATPGGDLYTTTPSFSLPALPNSEENQP